MRRNRRWREEQISVSDLTTGLVVEHSGGQQDILTFPGGMVYVVDVFELVVVGGGEVRVFGWACSVDEKVTMIRHCRRYSGFVLFVCSCCTRTVGENRHDLAPIFPLQQRLANIILFRRPPE